MKTKYFTLLELMAVIFVIALIMALISTVVPGVREKGRRTTCATQLRQLYSGLIAYSLDHNEQYPFGGATVEDFKKKLAPKYISETSNAWTCPSSEGDVGEVTYAIRKRSLSVYDLQAHMAIMADQAINHIDYKRGGYGNVLFGDGHVDGFWGIKATVELDSISISFVGTAWYEQAVFVNDLSEDRNGKETAKVALKNIGLTTTGGTSTQNWLPDFKTLSNSLLNK